MEIKGWNPEKRFKLEVHLSVTSKMLIAEIMRMYAIFDGEIATIRETGVAERCLEILLILLYPIISKRNVTNLV